MSDPVIKSSIVLSVLTRARLLQASKERFAKDWEGQIPMIVYFTLCPICLAPIWRQSSFEEAESTIFVGISSDLCCPCQEVHDRFPDIFKWVVYVLGMREVLTTEPKP